MGSCKLVSGCKASIIMTSTSVLLLCLATITIVASLTSFRPGVSSMEKIFDFNSEEEFTNDEAGNWYESSDTVRTAGMSKAAFSLQKSKLFQRAVMFAVINPQPNGAGFAGVKHNISLSNHEDKQGLKIQLRAQGDLKYWKVVLTKLYTYETKFPVNLQTKDFQTISIPFSDFQAFYRGQVIPDAPPLDLNKIGALGLQAFGGVYDQFKQLGVGSLELDFIALY